jgi:hypothetical protein
MLIAYCAYFKQGLVAQLWQAAWAFWHKMLSYAEVTASGSLILNILHAGNLDQWVHQTLVEHQRKFEEVGLSIVIVHTLRLAQEAGGYTDAKGDIKPYSSDQLYSMDHVIQLYENSDFGM